MLTKQELCCTGITWTPTLELQAELKVLWNYCKGQFLLPLWGSTRLWDPWAAVTHWANRKLSQQKSCSLVSLAHWTCPQNSLVVGTGVRATDRAGLCHWKRGGEGRCFWEQLSIRLHFHRQLPNFRLEFVSCREDVCDVNLICRVWSVTLLLRTPDKSRPVLFTDWKGKFIDWQELRPACVCGKKVTVVMWKLDAFNESFSVWLYITSSSSRFLARDFYSVELDAESKLTIGFSHCPACLSTWKRGEMLHSPAGQVSQIPAVSKLCLWDRKNGSINTM